MEILQRNSELCRRVSTETILSLQGKETDVVHDTSDSDSRDDGEWEPVDLEEELAFTDTDSSGFTDAEIISTKVIEVSVADDGDLQLADSELTAGSGSDLDSELDLLDFWKCARCEAANNNPLYRYCETCFKVRKNFFPPRPRRKSRLETLKVPRTLSLDSGVESQELSQSGPGPSKSIDPLYCVTTAKLVSQDSGVDSLELSQPNPGPSKSVELDNDSVIKPRPYFKRRAESADRRNKRIKVDYSDSETDSYSDCDTNRNVVSNPSVVPNSKIRKGDSNSDVPISKDQKDDNLCIMCCAEPKSGVFVHGRIAHICCCYKCAVKVWAKSKRCPVCNCKVSNVLKAVVM